MHYASLADAVLNGTGTERAFLCHVHGDTTPSASVNVLKGLWHCYACGASGSTKGMVEITPEMIRRRLLARERASRRREEHPSYPESWLKLFTASGPGPYWLQRFCEPICRAFDLGMQPDTGAAVYPLRSPSGDVLGVVERNLTDEGPKYKYPWGVDVRETAFAYDRCEDDEIVLVEGATDAIAAFEVGFQAMGFFGSSMGTKQVSLLRRYAPKRVGLAFDADVAGNRMARDVKRILSEVAPTVRVERVSWSPRLAKDLAAMPTDLRHEVLDRWHG